MNSTVDDREGGAVTAFASIMSVALILCAGLVIDGGAILAAKRDAVAAADSAARAGAQALDAEALNTTGDANLDPGPATAAAQSALAANSHQGRVSVEGRRVNVQVSINQPLYVLGLAGLGTKTVSAAATARAVRGVTQADQP